MTPLNDEQKQLLFDYCIGLTSEEEATEAEALISSNEEAAEIHSKLKDSLSPLESLAAEPCPDDLAEGTIWRLNNLARSSQLQLQQLLVTEQNRGATTKSTFWWDLGKRLAVAAVFMIVGSALIMTWRVASIYARQNYWKQQCQMQLSRVFQGISNYTDDHDGKLPTVATTAGSPWWKVGYQGKENHSNTRHMWILVKGDDASPADFMCPGNQFQAIQFKPSEIKIGNDFSTRSSVS